jgi:HK97 family phage prohead protease
MTTMTGTRARGGVQHKALPFTLRELKQAADGWEFSGRAATYDLDLGGDQIQPGAFDRTLRERAKRPLLWQHDVGETIGYEKSLRADSQGLLGTWGLVDTARGTDAYKLLKAGAIWELSIGYIAREADHRDDGVRLLRDLELIEVSVVGVAMNPMAVVTDVKARRYSQPASALSRRVVQSKRRLLRKGLLPLTPYMDDLTPIALRLELMRRRLAAHGLRVAG